MDQRRIKVYPFEPLEAGLPGARSLVVIERTTTFEQNEEPTIAFYITSHSPSLGCAARFGELARGHWGGCEIRNHWVRDSCMREDKTRSKNYNLNCNLSALRVCLVALKADLDQLQRAGDLGDVLSASSGRKVTKVPEPTRRLTSLAFSRMRSASRTVVRELDSAVASWRSAGRRSPLT